MIMITELTFFLSKGQGWQVIDFSKLLGRLSFKQSKVLRTLVPSDFIFCLSWVFSEIIVLTSSFPTLPWMSYPERSFPVRHSYFFSCSIFVWFLKSNTVVHLSLQPSFLRGRGKVEGGRWEVVGEEGWEWETEV